MSWGGGGEILESMVESIEENVLDIDTKIALYEDLIKSLLDCDWGMDYDFTTVPELYKAYKNLGLDEEEE